MLLVAADAAELTAWRRTLEKAGCRVFASPPVVATPEAALHHRIVAVLCVIAAGREMALPSLGVPVIMVVPETHAADASPSSAGVPTVFLGAPADSRHVIALVYAAAAGRFDADVAPVAVGGAFAVVADLHMVFWRERLLRLPAAERKVLCALVMAPGRVFRWDELVAMTGGAPVSGYIYVTRIRKHLRFCGAPTECLETHRGRGVTWTAAGRGDGHPDRTRSYHHES